MSSHFIDFNNYFVENKSDNFGFRWGFYVGSRKSGSLKCVCKFARCAGTSGVYLA